MRQSIASEDRFLATLRECRMTLRWLRESEPITAIEIPERHQSNLKWLEKVGIVFWRNSRCAQLRMQRLKRIAERAGATVSALDWLGERTESDKVRS